MCQSEYFPKKTLLILLVLFEHELSEAFLSIETVQNSTALSFNTLYLD